jgi:putative lipoprotein (rSAM/lipoprotein system)
MKRMNRQLIKGTNWALAGLMSLLGFSSCSSEEEYGTPKVEYGTPTAEFVVSGKVTDTNGRGLEGIRLTVPRVDLHQRATSTFIPDLSVITCEVKDTLYTHENGEFVYLYHDTPTNDSINIHLKAEGEHVETDSVKVTFFGSDLKGGSGWNMGRAEKKINIKLRNKEGE